MKVHQIFGILGDDKLPELFQKSHETYIDFCDKNNYQYKLWMKEDCEKLIEEYPEYKDLYYSVKYLIMRVDIIRFLILHKEGGMYSDLDVIPKIEKLKDSPLCLAWKVSPKKKWWEMEVLQSEKSNPILLDFLDYVKEQIKAKDKIDIYKDWKCRYVYQTTGPFSLHRFLKKNKVEPDKYLINHPLQDGLYLMGDEEFISYNSCSYFGRMDEIKPKQIDKEMRIVIPSYNRHLQIMGKSLKVVKDMGYDYSIVDLFVANQEEFLKYKAIVPSEVNIIIGVKGLKAIRDFIFNYYDEGQKLLCMDDDIEEIKMKNPRGWEESSFEEDGCPDMKAEIELAFKECEKSGRKLWGLYPVDNHYFMKNDITYDYKFIIGNFFGTINCKNMNKLEITTNIDDYERSIKSYLLYGGSVRLNYLCVKTRFLKNEGGANSPEFSREEKLEKDKINICKFYKDLVSLKKKKDGTNPVLKDKRKNKLSAEHYPLEYDIDDI
jgi:hypothetical protein